MEIKEILLIIMEIEEIKTLIIDLEIDSKINLKRKDLIITENIITIIIIKNTQDEIFNIKPVPCNW